MKRTEILDRTVGPRAMYIAAFVVVICAALWVTALCLGYLADDWGSPASSESSVPATETH
jgi:hypothetical protein